MADAPRGRGGFGRGRGERGRGRRGPRRGGRKEEDKEWYAQCLVGVTSDFTLRQGSCH